MPCHAMNVYHVRIIDNFEMIVLECRSTCYRIVGPEGSGPLLARVPHIRACLHFLELVQKRAPGG